MTPVTKQKNLGTFRIGHEYVILYAMKDSYNGSFDLLPDKPGLPFIQVGCMNDQWDRTVGVLLHETQEFLMKRLRLVFFNLDNMADEASEGIFQMDHTQFSEVCARTAMFMADVLPKLEQQWREWHQEADDKRISKIYATKDLP